MLVNKGFLDTTNIFESTLKDWSYTTFGDIHRNKNKVLARLKDIHNSIAWPHSEFLRTLEEDLTKENNSILKMKEDFWKSRSQSCWVDDGDANTKFFSIYLFFIDGDFIIFYTLKMRREIYQLI